MWVSSYSLLELFSLTSVSSLCVLVITSLGSSLAANLAGLRGASEGGGPSARLYYFRGLNMLGYLCAFSLSLLSFYYFYAYLASSSTSISKFYTFFLFSSIDFNLASLSLSLDIFGCILIFLAYVVGLFSLVSLDTRVARGGYRFYIYFNFFLVFVYIYAMATDLIIFFVAYELLLLPSFFFVYFVSYSKKAIQASLYFVM